MHETDARFHAVDFGAECAAAPDDLKYLFNDYESLAWRRRRHEREAMLGELLRRAGGAYAQFAENKTSFARRDSRLSVLQTELLEIGVRTRKASVSAVRVDGLWFDELFWLRVLAAVATFIGSIFAAQSFRAAVGDHMSSAFEPAP
jgi:hypothetical protein